MVKVLYTVDTEVWCDGWKDIDSKFEACFEKYVYGSYRDQQFGLPRHLEILSDYGLKGVFFTEPLFSLRFGEAALQTITNLITSSGHELQLHLHTEWLNELDDSPLDRPITEKVADIRQLPIQDQAKLLSLGKKLLEKSSGQEITAFRAGNFGADLTTLEALKNTELKFDSSLNPGQAFSRANFKMDNVRQQPFSLNGVPEFPLSTFVDGRDRIRQMQITACSSAELQQGLEAAEAAGWEYVTVLSHNFELMNTQQTRSDPIVASRLEKFCEFIAINSDRFTTIGFNDLPRDFKASSAENFAPIHVSKLATATRLVEQAVRRIYG